MASKKTFTRNDLTKTRRVVVKVGSALLAGTGQKPFNQFATQIARIRNSGTHVVLVSSGAIAQGIPLMGMKRRPSQVVQLQALAATGQPQLMHRWSQAFSKFNVSVAQLLLTHADLADRERHLNARQVLYHLEKHHVLPIANENDTVATDEIKVGDNDNLAAQVAVLAEADLLVLLTSVDGLYDANPEKNPQAQRIPIVTQPRDVLHHADKAGSSGLGVGGMQTKIEAASSAISYGVPVVIADGSRRHVLADILEGKDVGTLFLPRPSLQARKHWIGYTLRAKGLIHVDNGAVSAICKRGKSLLPSGITSVEGHFDRGTMVEIHGPRGVFARGLVAYSSEELNEIKGSDTRAIRGTLGYVNSSEVIHRNDLVLIS